MDHWIYWLAPTCSGQIPLCSSSCIGDLVFSAEQINDRSLYVDCMHGERKLQKERNSRLEGGRECHIPMCMQNHIYLPEHIWPSYSTRSRPRQADIVWSGQFSYFQHWLNPINVCALDRYGQSNISWPTQPVISASMLDITCIHMWPIEIAVKIVPLLPFILFH